MTPPPLWLRCSGCNLILRCPPKTITLREHHQFNGKALCKSTRFSILEQVSDEEMFRADRERERRAKKYALLHPKKARKPFEKKKSTSRWDGVRATRARPSRGTAGLPTLGKR